MRELSFQMEMEEEDHVAHGLAHVSVVSRPGAFPLRTRSRRVRPRGSAGGAARRNLGLSLMLAT